MNITGNAKKMRRGLVVATLLGSMSLLGVEMVGTGFASANTPGQITVGLFTCSQAGCSVTVSGSGFGSGQKESVEAVDPTNNVVWGSASVTTSLPRLGTTGTIYGPGTAGSPGGTFSVQLPIGQFMTSGCFQHLDITAAAPVLIGGHENGLINSNTAVVESACLL